MYSGSLDSHNSEFTIEQEELAEGGYTLSQEQEKNMMKANIDNLLTTFKKNRNKRICVLSTTCTGKIALMNKLNIGLDIDKQIFPLLTKKEVDYVCSTPQTEKIGQKMDEFVRTKLSINLGAPMFGIVLLDCDLIVYLHINEELFLEGTKLRNVDFKNVKIYKLKQNKR